MKKLQIKCMLLKEISCAGIEFFQVRKSVRNELKKYLNYQELHDDSIVKDDHSRLEYYGLLGVLFAQTYAKLLNRKLDKKERELHLLLGFLTPLFDDFYDNENWTRYEVVDFIENLDGIQVTNSKERLIVNIYSRVNNLIEDKNQILDTYKEVHQGQELSKRQFDSDVSYKELLNITYIKGGSSFTFIRDQLKPKTSEQERKYFYRLGFLFQLESDLFDLHKDYVNGIKTIPQITEDWTYFRDKYRMEVNRLISGFDTVRKSYDSSFSFQLRMALILSRGLVMLDQLENLQIKNGNSFSVKNYSRKDLICDMDTLKNFRKMFSYAVSICSGSL